MKKFKLALIPLFIITLSGSTTIEPPFKLNVLFIIADDLNCAIGAYGDGLVKTPNLDKLAKEGVVYNKAYVSAPVCSASRSAMISLLLVSNLQPGTCSPSRRVVSKIWTCS